MFSVPHIVVLFIVVLVVFGPHKLPELARGLGKLMAEFRKASTDFKLAFEEEMRNVERQAREAERKKQADAAAASASAAETTNEAPVSQGTPAEQIEAIEPVVAPVNEAVARGEEEKEPTSELDAAHAETASDGHTESHAGQGQDLQEKALQDPLREHGHTA